MNFVVAIPKSGTSMNALAGISTIIEMAENLSGRRFNLLMVCEHSTDSINIGRYSVKIDKSLSQVRKADYIIIPPLIGNFQDELKENRNLVKWILKMNGRSTQIASLCTGAYLLAESGLLDNQEASSHCDVIPDLKRCYNRVRWMEDKIITDNNGIYTSGGAFSSLNLVLYIIEKLIGYDTAIEIANTMQIDFFRKTQSPFLIFSNQKNHNDEQILLVQEYMEKVFTKDITIEAIAATFHMSRRNLIRRFKASTGNTPINYLQRLRIEKAKTTLLHTDLSISETMYQVGYSDMSTFRNTFKRYTGQLPSYYKAMLRS